MVPDAEIIAAIATAPGKGAVGIVRVSGRRLEPLMMGILGRTLQARRLVHSSFQDSRAGVIDEGLAVFFAAPASYTGEDCLELQGHGGPVVLQMVLERCLELGARPALPGEFTKRAFLNHKLDLAQAEAVADLIDASTAVSARCALRSLRGEFSKAVDRLARQLIDLRMLVEAGLDFPEEDIEPAERNDAIRGLRGLQQSTASALESAQRGSVLRNGLSVVIAGRPNMGKSSLLNALAGDDLALVTPVPGTTRDAIRQTIQVAGVPLNIVDTAGLRETPDEVERLGIGRTWQMIERADVALLIVDAATGMLPEDQAILQRLPAGIPRIIVHNKVDLAQVESSRTVSGTDLVVCLSAKTGSGLDLLRQALLEIAGWQPGNEDVFMARVRHLDALRRALGHFNAAEQVLGQPELFAEELRLGQRELGAITGEFVADDLLGEIFSRFCIGK